MFGLIIPTTPAWLAAMLLTAALAVRGAVPRGRRRPVRARALLRALLPRRILRSRSGRLDIAGFLFSRLLAVTMLGWALVSASWWAALAERTLAPWPALPVQLPMLPAAILMTTALFVAYEAAYWLNHWLSHRVEWLWMFHRVHHSAESLSLLTNFRVHPVDTIVFFNMAAAITGLSAGVLRHLIGPGATEISVSDTNLLVYVTSIVLVYLQHSHLWMATTGRWGRWLLSPAHHQIHHSTDPRHYNRNLGSTLGLFDWLAGTLVVPTTARQPLRFGVDGLEHDPHGFRGAVLQPFADAARAIAPTPGSLRGREGAAQPATSWSARAPSVHQSSPPRIDTRTGR